MSDVARDILARRDVLVIAHRGASAGAPENTLPAFQAALDAGADLVEFDTRVSRDGVPVVLHDETLDRTTDAVMRWGGAPMRVAAYAAEALRNLDAGAWFDPRFAGTGLPTLVEALDVICRGAVALIERKSGDALTLVALLEDLGLVERVVVQAFDGAFLGACRKRCPQLALGALGEGPMTASALAPFEAAEVAVVGWEHERIDAHAVQAVHARGLRLWAWTVNEEPRAVALVALGVDGLITDRPAAIRAALLP